MNYSNRITRYWHNTYTSEYYRNGVLHNLCGPAVVIISKRRKIVEWWEYGKLISYLESFY